MHCPENHFCFIQSCWEENPHRRPSFSEIKDHIFNHPVFPKHHVVANVVDSGANGRSSLAVPSSYEIMRRQYRSIQRCNPVYLTMVGQRQQSSFGNSESISSQIILGTIEEEEAVQEDSNLLRFPSEEDDPMKTATSVMASTQFDISTEDKAGRLDIIPCLSEEDKLLLNYKAPLQRGSKSSIFPIILQPTENRSKSILKKLACF